VINNGGSQALETAELLNDAAPRVTELAAPEIAVVAMRPAWIRVSLSDGTVLFEKILDGGESFQLPNGAISTTLRAGNSGSVYLTLDGTPYGPVGGDTSVVKDIALDVAKIAQAFRVVENKEALLALDSPRVITLNSSN